MCGGSFDVFSLEFFFGRIFKTRKTLKDVPFFFYFICHIIHIICITVYSYDLKFINNPNGRVPTRGLQRWRGQIVNRYNNIFHSKKFSPNILPRQIRVTGMRTYCRAILQSALSCNLYTYILHNIIVMNKSVSHITQK